MGYILHYLFSASLEIDNDKNDILERKLKNCIYTEKLDNKFQKKMKKDDSQTLFELEKSHELRDN